MIKKIGLEIFGWSGAMAVVAAYALTTFGVIPVDDLRYQILNLFGSVAVIFHTAHKRAWPSFSVNIIWSIIAVFSIVALLRR